MTKIDVSMFNYGRRGWRVRAFMAGPDFNSFGRVLSEEFKKTEASALKAAKEMAARYGVEFKDPRS